MTDRTRQKDLTGQRLGNYRLLRVLGHGAFAEVYMGEHLYLKDYAAIKVLLTSLDEKDEQLFLSEGQTLARLTHPNIVRVREFAIEHSIPFLAMDYAAGGTLRQRHPKGSRLSIDQVVHYARQIAFALQYAHNHNIIHRDVKPENILLGTNHLLLSDFGISLHTSSQTGQMAGTLPYIAPEQLQGHPVFASDQYSLGILLYEWLCGTRPFEGSSSEALIYQHMTVPPTSLRAKDSSIPEGVEAVILKALAKNPGDRYVSMLAFVRALERATGKEDLHRVPDNTDETLEPDASDPAFATLPRRIFLSCASADSTFASCLKSDLQDREVTVEEGAAQIEEEPLRQAIRAAQVVLLVTSSQERASPVLKEHLRIADLYRRPVLAIWSANEAISEWLPTGAEQSVIIDARESRYQQALDEILTRLERERRGAPVVEPYSPEPSVEPRNPYKGLRSFTQEDRADFFGREAQVQELVETLKKMLTPASPGLSGERVLAVVGPSGSGKSSVVMAGLLPKLQEGALAESESWIYLPPMVPDKHPLESLAYALVSYFPGKSMQDIHAILNTANVPGLHQLATSLMRGPGSRVVLLIDQFEELFSADVPEQERRQVIELLTMAATEPGGPLLLLLAMRADFYDRPMAYPDLGRLIQQHQCTILPLDMEDLRAVIERPAALADVRLSFDADLVGDLLYDLRDQVGALPLLEFTLDQLFYHRRGNRLTRRAYQEIGGVRGALSKHAESTYMALPSDEHRRLARTLLLRLIQHGASEREPVRRRTTLAEFRFEDATQTRLMQEVIDAFIAARLLTTSKQAGTTMLEISHEALVREWPRLAEWIGEAKEDIQLQQALSNDVAEWEQRKQPKDRLYRGAQLKEAQTWTSRNSPSEQEATFLQASARQQMLSLVLLIVVGFLLISSLGVAGWYVFSQPSETLVTTLKDNNTVGSLRWCIDNAPSGSTITFAQSVRGTIELTGGDLVFVSGKQLTIEGPGANQLTITGGNRNVHAHVSPGATLNLSDLSFRNSETTGDAFLFNEGTLKMTRSVISNNSNNPNRKLPVYYFYGGGIENTGTLTVIGSTISHNASNRFTSSGFNGNGGGIYNKGTLTVTNSTFSDNIASAAGGGIDNEGKLIVSNSTIANNIANLGGGIVSFGRTIDDPISATMIVSNSIFSNNTAGDVGGGIDNYSNSVATVSNSTFSKNTASSSKYGGSGGGINNSGKLAVSNSAFVNNVASCNSNSISCSGGGINNNPNGVVAVSNSTFSKNTASSSKYGGSGGGINNGGKLTVSNGTFTNNVASCNSNSASCSGGGIANSGKLAVSNSIFANNIARNSGKGFSIGGGIGNFNASIATVSNSTFSGNTASNSGGSSLGGGIDNEGKLTVSSSTIANNIVSSSSGISFGGGIYNYQASTVAIINSTFSGNMASNSSGNSQGGGIDNEGKLIVSLSTFLKNIASSSSGSSFGGGIDNYADGKQVTISSSIIAANKASNGPDIVGALISGGYNLFTNKAGVTGLNARTDRQVTLADLKLDSVLRNNGGPTQTLALLPGSPAIDAVPENACKTTFTDASGNTVTITTDQRGKPRPDGSENVCDIGAYESSY